MRWQTDATLRADPFSRPRWLRYGAALLLTVAVTLVAHELDPYWDTAAEHPYLVEWPTIIVAAWLGGLGPGLLATGLSTAGILFYWITPFRSFHVTHASDVVALALYGLCGAVVTLLIQQLHLSRAKEHAMRRSREILLGIVAHDLRNPLNTIALSTSLLRRRPEPARVDAIERAAARMDRLICDLVDASVLEAGGGLKVACADEDVGAIVAEALAAAGPEAERRGILLAADDVPKQVVQCDRQRILQVLGNLLGNALKFTPEGGRITVRATALESFVRIEVADSGPGIKLEDQTCVFDRHWSGRTAGAGTGLGLYIAHGIVRVHGGQIWLHSEGGHGTTFFFTLSRAKAGGEASAHERDVVRTPRAG